MTKTANSTLIASAPELLEALKAIKELAPSTCNSIDDSCACIKCIAMQAIAKAEGKSR